MDVPSTYKNNKNAVKWSENDSEGSLKRDLFIVIVGLILIIFAFVLFLTVSGLQLEKGFPLQGKVVVGDDGELLNATYSKIAPGTAKRYIQTGIILGLVALIVFVSTLVIVRWTRNKKVDVKPSKKPGLKA